MTLWVSWHKVSIFVILESSKSTTNNNGNSNGVGFRSGSGVDGCFTCGEVGHIAKECSSGGGVLLCVGNGYSLKDKVKGKNDKTEHGIGKSMKSRSQKTCAS
ncbi:cold shock domain-containing protein 3-like protein [Tanacetum coccineum]